MSDSFQRLKDWVDAPEGPTLIVVEEKQDHPLGAGPHRHARGQLFGSLRGLLSVGVEAGVWLVPAIHAVWLPPRLEHWGRSHGPFHGWSAYVAESACADLPKRACTIRTSGLLREAVLRASSWAVEIPLCELEPESAHLAAVILHEIRTLPVEPFGLPLPTDPRMARIARALMENPADDRDLESWAAWGAVSARTLSRRFVAETGFNFTAWRQRARMLQSLEMLAAGLPVSTVALDLGYSTASAFISLFRRTFGETPAIYRRRLG
jgi:AraC-like DNA-binding protein